MTNPNRNPPRTPEIRKSAPLPIIPDAPCAVPLPGLDPVLDTTYLQIAEALHPLVIRDLGNVDDRLGNLIEEHRDDLCWSEDLDLDDIERGDGALLLEALVELKMTLYSAYSDAFRVWDEALDLAGMVPVFRLKDRGER